MLHAVSSEGPYVVSIVGLRWHSAIDTPNRNDSNDKLMMEMDELASDGVQSGSCVLRELRGGGAALNQGLQDFPLQDLAQVDRLETQRAPPR